MAGLRDRHKDRRRRAIVEAATHLLREKGLDGLSVPEIAAMADVSPATVYNLVGGQNALAAAVLSDAIQDLTLDEGPPSSRDPLIACVDHVGHVIAQFALREREIRPILLLYITRRGSPDWNAERPMLQVAERAIENYGGAVARAQADGAFDPRLPSRTVAMTLFAAMKHRIDAWTVGQLAGEDARDLIRRDAAVVLLSGALGPARERLIALAAA